MEDLQYIEDIIVYYWKINLIWSILLHEFYDNFVSNRSVQAGS